MYFNLSIAFLNYRICTTINIQEGHYHKIFSMGEIAFTD